MAQTKTITPAHLKLYVNGQLIGIAMGGSYQIQTAVRDIRAIDSNVAYELAPTQCDVSGTIQIVRLHGTGGIEGEGIAAFDEEILLQKYSTITLVDRKTDLNMQEFGRCLCTGQQWNIPTRGIVTGSFSFKGTAWSNEAAS